MLTTAKYKLDSTTTWSTKRKEISYYVNKLIRTMYSQAGVSPTIKPGISHLPNVTITNVEYAHNMFHHIWTRTCNGVKQSFANFNNETIHSILCQLWNVCCISCIYRPADCCKSNLRDCSKTTQVSLKTIHTYRSAFELSVNGDILGFGTMELSLLRRLVEWNGKWFCDTWNDDMIDWLIEEAHQIAITLNQSDLMPDFNDDTPCLRTWLTLVDICLFWFENAMVFVGLKFERGNKLTKIKMLTSWNVNVDILLKNLVTHTRLVKDIFAQALACTNNSNPFGRLGWGLREIISDLKTSVSPLKKLLMYECKIQSDEIELINDSDFHNKSILHSVPKLVTTRAWTNLINFLETHASKLTKKEGKLACKLWYWFKFIVKAMFIARNCDEARDIQSELLRSCKCGDVKFYLLVGISTFYRTWTDSVIKKNDTVFVRQSNHEDDLLRIDQIVKINGLESFANRFDYNLNPNFTTHWSCIIAGFCNQWKLEHDNNHGFNYELYSIHNTPTILLSNDKRVINVEWIVQQCYMSHDHIIPCKQDLIGVQRAVSNWPSNNESNWPNVPNPNLIDVTNVDIDELPYCGIGWKCSSHNQLNCAGCLNDIMMNKGQIIYDCKQDDWSYFKAFTIYQGYIPRLFNARTINELGW